MIFREPKLAVGEEEMNHFILSIVEAKTVPCWMLMTVAWIEILVGVASQIAQAFHFILNGMALHQVHDDSDTVLVGFINELFEFVGRTETAGSCKETAHVIAKTTIIRMFLKGHYLEAVVAFLNDTRQDILAKFIV